MPKQLSPEQIKLLREWMASDRVGHPHELPFEVKNPYVLGDFYADEQRIINPALSEPDQKTRYYVTNIITKTVRDNCWAKKRSMENRLIYLGLPLIMEGNTIIDIDDTALAECRIPLLITWEEALRQEAATYEMLQKEIEEGLEGG